MGMHSSHNKKKSVIQKCCGCDQVNKNIELEICPSCKWSRIETEMESDVQGKSILQGTIKDFPKNTTLPEYFSHGFAQGRIRPDNLALVDGEKQHTFYQLDDISNKIADAILECIPNVNKNHNPDGDPVIGVCLQPSDRLIAILLGILKAGAAYVPFDITFPEERILRIVKDCRPLMIICDDKSNVHAKFESSKEHTIVVSTAELFRNIKPGRRIAKLYAASENENQAEKTAIVLYTSGSSGEPKGVRLSHRAVLNRLSWQWMQFPFIPTEKCVFKTSLTFVDSVPEIFGPLLQGYQLIVFDKIITSQPSLFIEKLHASEITRVVLVPSLLKAIFQTLSLIGSSAGKKLLNSVRLWVCSGEALSLELLTEFFHFFPEKFTLCNFYGSTEVMGDVTFISFSSQRDVNLNCMEKRVPIGFSLQNTTIYILNEQLVPVKMGEVGEIFISGDNLCTGYVGIPDSDKFLPIPTTMNYLDRGKMYRTGDFGRISKLKNGTSVLMYEGRMDSQIKVRGQRVDLSEIEAGILRSGLVSKVKVLCYHPGDIDQSVVAYIVPTSSFITQENIHLAIEETLRVYERPIVRLLNEIPLLVNGKTDRQRLLKMFQAEITNREEFDNWESLSLPPEKLDLAKVLLQTISQVTGTSLQTIAENFDDSFFNVGGTSLNTVVVIVKLRERNYYISIPEFTSARSIREILMCISAVEDNSSLTTNSQEYIVSLLTDQDKEEAIHIMSYSFSKKGDLEAYVNVTYNDFATLIKSIWADIVEKQFSFIVRRASNGKIVAVSFSFDVYDEPSESDCTQGIKYVMDFLELVESQQRSFLPSGKGKLLHSFMMGTAEDVDDSESVSLIEFMEEQNILIGKQHKFLGILTTNTNPLTMQIGRDLHGYEILSEYQVNEYSASDGTKPFGLAPDSFKIICCWKRLY